MNVPRNDHDDACADWQPFDALETEAQLSGLQQLLRDRPAQHIVDLGCGSGRMLLPLLEEEHHIIGVDHDARALAAITAQLQSQSVDVRNRATLICCDMLDIPLEADGQPVIAPGSCDLVLCLGNTFMSIVDVAAAAGLLCRVANWLRPESGRFVIDDFPHAAWAEIVEHGTWQNGISDDQSQQMIFQPGDDVFALRTGSAVDEDNWTINESDRCFRMWSLGLLQFIAQQAGFATLVHDAEHHLIVLQR
ncbi:MAG: class I SAM-dependent methyltransferase [Phycisphaerales bacterium]